MLTTNVQKSLHLSGRAANARRLSPILILELNAINALIRAAKRPDLIALGIAHKARRIISRVDDLHADQDIALRERHVNVAVDAVLGLAALVLGREVERVAGLGGAGRGRVVGRGLAGVGGLGLLLAGFVDCGGGGAGGESQGGGGDEGGLHCFCVGGGVLVLVGKIK